MINKQINRLQNISLKINQIQIYSKNIPIENSNAENGSSKIQIQIINGKSTCKKYVYTPVQLSKFYCVNWLQVIQLISRVEITAETIRVTQGHNPMALLTQRV